MADNIMKLGLVLSATDKMSRVVDRAVGKSFDKLKGFQRRTAAIGGAMQKWGTAMTGTGALIEGGMFAATKSVAATAFDLSRSSQKVGMNVEQWQKISYAAGRVKVDADQFRASLQRLQKQQVAAATGNKTAAQSFAMAGISIADANGKLKSSDVLFAELADKFSKAKDGPKKTALAMRLFGRTGAELIPLLNKGSAGISDFSSQAEKMGLVLSTSQIEAFKKYGQQQRMARDAMDGFKNTIATGALPILTKIIKKMVEYDLKIVAWTKRHKALTTGIIGTVASVAAILTVMGTVGIVAGTLMKSISAISKVFNMLKFAAFSVRFAIFQAGISMKACAASQWVLNAATTAWNAILAVNPVVWMVAGIAALVAIVVVCWKKFAGFRAAIKATWEVIKGFGNIIKEYVIDRIKGVISGLGLMGRAIGLLFHGKFSEAFQTAKSGIKELSGYNAAVSAKNRASALIGAAPAIYRNKYEAEKAKEQNKTAIQTIRDHRKVVEENSRVSSSMNNSNVIHYSPVIHLNGNASDKESFAKMLRDHKNVIEGIMRDSNNNNRRLSFMQMGD